MAKDVIIALDFENKEKTLAFLDQFTGRKPFVKIGMELFYAEGPDIVREIKARGHKIFLDLKLHAAGTIAMMQAAKEGLTKEDGTCGVLLAVTQLTSTSEERMQQELLINATMPETVKKYAQNAKAAGLSGVVCSPLEAALVKEACGQDFLTVTPGIRFADGDVGDQVRVMTPAKARLGGSDYIVVGRPITAAADPVAAYERCVKEFLGE